MDGKTFLLTLVFGFLAMTVLGAYCGVPEMGPIVAIAVAGGADRLAPPEGRGGAGARAADDLPRPGGKL